MIDVMDYSKHSLQRHEYKYDKYVKIFRDKEAIKKALTYFSKNNYQWLMGDLVEISDIKLVENLMHHYDHIAVGKYHIELVKIDEEEAIGKEFIL